MIDVPTSCILKHDLKKLKSLQKKIKWKKLGLSKTIFFFLKKKNKQTF